MKAAAAAMKSIDFDIQGNIERISELFAQIKQKKASYLFIGEASLNGFDGLTWKYDKDIIENAFDIDGRVISELRRLCRKYEVGLGVGCYEKHDENISNSYFIFDKHGKTECRYRRISKGWKGSVYTDSRYTNGQEYSFVKLGNTRYLISICGDLWDPEYFNGLNKLYFDAILWPVYLDYSINEWEYAAEKEYCDQIKMFGKRTILINSRGIRTDSAKGGIMEISASGDIVKKIEMESSEVMIFEL